MKEKEKKLKSYLESLAKNKNTKKKIEATILEILELKEQLKTKKKLDCPDEIKPSEYAVFLSSCPDLLQKIRVNISKRGLVTTSPHFS